MGLERQIRFATGAMPEWPAIVEQLLPSGERPLLRMIDGVPAFPEEVPTCDWSELRIALAGGMVTLRREPGLVRCICWDTGDPTLIASWNALCLAVEQAGNGFLDERS